MASVEEKVNSSEGKQQKPRAVRCVVVSDKMSKTRVGRIDRIVRHKVFGKYLKRSTRVAFHDEDNTSRLGDIVLITPSRPMSATKRFKLLSVLKQSAERQEVL